MIAPVGGAALPQLLIEGDGPRTVLMLHGWPDTHRVWDSTVAALRHQARCVRFTLPGFDPGQAHGPRHAVPLAEVVQCIARVADEVSPKAPVTLMLHDWGCFFGYQYAHQHKTRVERVIGVDIGDAGSRHHRREMSWRAMALTLGYQLWLAAAWRIGGKRGNRMARWIAKLFHAPAAAPDITASQGYPYAIQWFGVAGGFGQLRAFAPQVPMLFVHGQRKPMMFHSSNWAERIGARPGCRVLGFPTGHWVMNQAPAEFNAAVLQWLQDTEHLCRGSERNLPHPAQPLNARALP